MKKDLAFWREHMAAIEQEGISISAYAKRHDIPLKRLYYWLRKVRLAAAPAKASGAKAFVALRISEPEAVPVPMGCVLILAGGMCLEIPALPSPTWLMALTHLPAPMPAP